MRYSDYLQAKVYVRDITGAIGRAGNPSAGLAGDSDPAARSAVAEQLTTVVASNDALTREFGRGFDAATRTVHWSFDVMSQGLDSVHLSVEELNAAFGFRIGLVVTQRQAQRRLLHGVAERLDLIHRAADSPTAVRARELFRTGCERLERGLLDKALEAFIESDKANDADYLTQLQLGRLYLYGKNEDDDVVDLDKAHAHLLHAARYGKSELAALPEAEASTAEALLHAAIACYLLASEAGLDGDDAMSRKRLEESVQLAEGAAGLRPVLGEAHYQAARGLALLGRPDDAAAALERAIAVDRRYCLRVADDPDFGSARITVSCLLERLHADALARARQLLAEKRRLVDSFVYDGDAAQAVQRTLEDRLATAGQMLGRTTLFDCQDASTELLHIFAQHETEDYLKLGRELATLDGHSGDINSLAFSPDGSLLASACHDAVVKLWDVPQKREAATLSGHASLVHSVAFSPDGAIIASGSDDKTVKLWDVRERRETATLSGHSGAVHSVAFCPDGALLASGSWDGTVKLWDLHERREVATLTGHSSSVRSVAFSPDGATLASGSYKMVKLWDVLRRRELAILWQDTNYVESVAFSPDGKLLASGGWDGTVKPWDVRERRELPTLPGHGGLVHSVAFSPDSAIIASGSDDKTVKLWDVREQRELTTLSGDGSSVRAIAFSPDGSLLASGSTGGTLKLWDLRRGVIPRTEWDRLVQAREATATARAERDARARVEVAAQAQRATERERKVRAAEERARAAQDAELLRETRQIKGLCLACGAGISFMRRLSGSSLCATCARR